MSGEAGDAQTAGFLVALRAKGETAEELAGPGRDHPRRAPSGSRRRRARSSTPAAPAAAARPSTSRRPRPSSWPGPASRWPSTATARPRRACGSADVLEALGARIDLDPDAVGRCLEETGLGFMFAPGPPPGVPAHRPGAPRARACGRSSTSSGPLTNPAGAPRQLLGVSDAAYLERMGRALAELGCERAMLVRGRDGMDELFDRRRHRRGRTWTAPASPRATIDPAALGFAPPRDGAIAGSDPAGNAEVLRAVLAGEPGPARDVVVLNAAAALWLAGVAPDLRRRRPARRREHRRAAPRASAWSLRRRRPAAWAARRLAGRGHLPRDRRGAHRGRRRAPQARDARGGAARRAWAPVAPRAPVLGGADRRGHLADRRDEAGEPVARPDPPRRERRRGRARLPGGGRAGRVGAHRAEPLRRQPRRPRRGPRRVRPAAAAQGLRGRRLPAARGAGGGRRRRAADRRRARAASASPS